MLSGRRSGIALPRPWPQKGEDAKETIDGRATPLLYSAPMNPPVRRARTFSAALCSVVAVATASGQGNRDLATAHSQAMAEFQAGNYAKAATDLEALVARVEVTPQVEPIFYTIGSAYFNAGDYPKAIAAFKNYQAKFPQGPTRAAAPLSPSPSRICSARISRMRRRRWRRWRTIPQLREQALLFEAEALKAAGKTDDAIRTLEKLAGQEIRTPDAMRGATMLAQLYAEKGDGAKALRTLEAIHQKIALADNIIELNALTVELGDKFYDKQQFKEALACYRSARVRANRSFGCRTTGSPECSDRIEENLAAIRANPTQITQLTAVNNQLKASIANAQEAARGIRETALDNPGNLPAPWPLFLRARSQMGSGRRQPGNPRPLQGRSGA